MRLLVTGGAGFIGANFVLRVRETRPDWQVTVLERHAGPAEEGSGNPQGVLYLKLSAHGTALSRLVVSGFGYTRRLLERLQRGQDWDACGVLQLAYDDKEQQRQAELAGAFPEGLVRPLDQADAEALADEIWHMDKGRVQRV